MNQHLNYKNFTIASIISILSAIIIFIINSTLGNDNFFLLLNNDYGQFADTTFTFITHLGEAAPWVIAFVFCIIYRRQFLPLIIFALIVSTALAQGIKNNLPEQARPTKAITNLNLIHTVKGVELHVINSFPSGHTTAAFTVFLIACLLIKNKWVISIGFLYAIAVGYSRVYLAQHFPKDVAGGMLVAVIATCFAIVLQQYVYLKFSKKNRPN